MVSWNRLTRLMLRCDLPVGGQTDPSFSGGGGKRPRTTSGGNGIQYNIRPLWSHIPIQVWPQGPMVFVWLKTPESSALRALTQASWVAPSRVLPNPVRLSDTSDLSDRGTIDRGGIVIQGNYLWLRNLLVSLRADYYQWEDDLQWRGSGYPPL